MPIPKVGDLVAHKFRIEGTLGEGGMAYVLAAHHELLDKPVAMKILDPNILTDATHITMLIDRFLAEARAAARVDSQHVARIMDVGTLDGGLPYIVMERLDGSDLEQLLEIEKTLRIEDAIDFVLQALAGLAHAHALGIIHRDLKPANLFLARQRDGGSIVKILDFGVAKLVDTPTKAGATLDGTAVGTPMYMAPEQIRTPMLVDTRVDIWAIGVVLHELLTGNRPFTGDEMPDIFSAVLDGEIPGVRASRREVDEGLERVILHCLERDLSKRYRDVGQVAHALAPYGSGQWHAVIDDIDATLHGRASVISKAEVMPSRRPEGRNPRTETNIETPSEPMPPVKRSSVWRVIVLAVAVAGAIVFGVRRHAFDSLVKGKSPPPPVTEAPSASAPPSASSAPSAIPTPAKSVRPPPKPTVSVKKPTPKPTATATATATKKK